MTLVCYLFERISRYADMTKNKPLRRTVTSCRESSTIFLKANEGNPKRLGNTGRSPEAAGYILHKRHRDTVKERKPAA